MPATREEYTDYWGEYTGTSVTGAAKLLAERNLEMRKACQERDLERIKWELRNMRQELSHYRILCEAEPEPSVEVHNYTPSWWSRIKDDPIWEIFKRPKIK